MPHHDEMPKEERKKKLTQDSNANNRSFRAYILYIQSDTKYTIAKKIIIKKKKRRIPQKIAEPRCFLHLPNNYLYPRRDEYYNTLNFLQVNLFAKEETREKR